MSSQLFYQQWKLAIIDHDKEKVNKLRSITKSTVYHFHNTLSFIDHLRTMDDAQERLILMTSSHLIKDLPLGIEDKLHRLYIYRDNNETEFQSLDDICLHLSNLIIVQCTERSIDFHRSNENGPARAFAQESINRSKIFIKQLQDLCDNIDDKIVFSQEAMN